MMSTVEIYHWEDDPHAEQIIEELKRAELKFEATLLDAEDPNSRPLVRYRGETYWELEEFWLTLRAV